MVDIAIRDGTLIDGTGHSSHKTDILIDDGKIDGIGNFPDIEATTNYDASGMVVTPGFIDIHNHSDFTLYVDGTAQSGIRQGITTAVIGNCGHGPAPAPDSDLAKQVTIGVNKNWGIDFDWNTFDQYLDALMVIGQSINIAPLVGHGPIRIAVMGFDARQATESEIDSMCSLLEAAMSAGAMGISTGLEYSPGRHASENELIQLAKVVGKHGGIYSSHIRERGDNFVEAVTEALTISKHGELPAQLSHLAPRPYAAPEIFDRVLENISEYRNEGNLIGIDTFPDPWGPAHLLDLVPPWVYEGSDKIVLQRLRDKRTADKCREYILNGGNFLLKVSGFDKFFLSYSKSHPELMNHSIKHISDIWNIDIVETIFKLAADDEDDFGSVLIRHIFSTTEDLDKLLSDPYCSVGSDGAITSLEGVLSKLPMNRSSFGYVPRFIQEYSVNRKLFTIEESVRKLSSLPASQVKLEKRGTIVPGNWADVAVIDIDRLKDLTTDDSPQAYPTGIEMIIVNGEIVLANHKHTGLKPGQITSHL